MSQKKAEKLGWQGVWAMAVGGMIGGGIFSVLGVVIDIAGQWAWLSFLLGGLIALCACYSYAGLAAKFSEGGGAFTFLRETGHSRFAGALSWVLILGYVLTISVYAYTFGHYLAYAIGLGSWFASFCAVIVIAAIAGLNLRGVGDASFVEIVAVWGKLIVLVGLAGIGLAMWAPDRLTQGIESASVFNALTGAAVVFMAYEGFQLLAYDYEDIRNAATVLPQATITAVICVIVIYIVVAVGTAMIVGAGTIVEQKEVALAVAGRQLAGFAGLIIVTAAAAFSTISAINATVFSTARLMQSIAHKNEFPPLLRHENAQHVPSFAIYGISGLGAVLAVTGSLTKLVDAASLVFLFTFGIVSAIGWQQKLKSRWICLIGALGSGAAIIVSVVRLIEENLAMLVLIAVTIAVIVFLRPLILKRSGTQPDE